MNIIYFDNIKLKNNNILTINYNPKNRYTFDFFIEELRKNVIIDIKNKIKNKNPVVIYSLCATSCASILYVYELNKIINNKITLILFSPMLSLDKEKFLNKTGFRPGHSIHNIFKNFKNNKEYEEIVKQVFKNNYISKVCFFSELDPTQPKDFNKQIYKISNNLTTLEFKKSKLHNFFSLFYYVYSKNFQKFREKNWYIGEEDLLKVSSIWNDNLTIEKLSDYIIKKNFNIFVKYDFIEIEIYD